MDYPSGNMACLTGGAMEPTGRTILPTGRMVLPYGMVALPTESIVFPHGSVVLPTGTIVLPHGIVRCRKEASPRQLEKCLIQQGQPFFPWEALLFQMGISVFRMEASQTLLEGASFQSEKLLFQVKDEVVRIEKVWRAKDA